MSDGREVLIRAHVSEIGDDHIVVHPKGDKNQSITIPIGDVIAFAGSKPEKKEVEDQLGHA